MQAIRYTPPCFGDSHRMIGRDICHSWRHAWTATNVPPKQQCLRTRSWGWPSPTTGISIAPLATDPERSGFVDDFYVATPDLWVTVVLDLLGAIVDRARSADQERLILVAAQRDVMKRTMLVGQGFESEAAWWVRTIEETAAEQALQVARGVVEDPLHLRLHPEKTRILDARDTPFDFLGFTFFWTDPGDTGRPLFGPKSAATARLKDRVRVLTRRKRPASLNMVIQDLAPVIRGWGQYFTISQHGEYYRLDAWIRERCRAFVAKRWNRSRALDRVWTNQRLADLGLPSLAAMRRNVLAQPPRP